MAMLHTSENRKRCMRLQKAVSSIAWLARAKQDAQRTKNLSKKNSTDACSYFAKEYSFLALTEHMGEIFFSNLATLNIFSSVLWHSKTCLYSKKTIIPPEFYKNSYSNCPMSPNWAKFWWSENKGLSSSFLKLIAANTLSEHFQLILLFTGSTWTPHNSKEHWISGLATSSILYSEYIWPYVGNDYKSTTHGNEGNAGRAAT